MAERDMFETLQNAGSARMSRRGFLQVAGLSGAAAALAACTGGGSAPSTEASVAASVAAPSTAPSLAASPTPMPSYQIEKALYMYNWAQYISPKNIDAFKAKFGVSKFQYDVYDNNNFVFPLKMLGFSANSVDKDQLDQARTVLLDIAPHLLALDSNQYGTKMAKGEASLALGWTGVLEQQMSKVKDKGYVVPSDGTIFWMDTWVLLTGAPDPNASYAWLNFIHEPAVQAEESDYNLYATPNDKARPLVDPVVLNNTAIFPTEEQVKALEGSKDTSSNTQRLDIWEEFKQNIGKH